MAPAAALPALRWSQGRGPPQRCPGQHGSLRQRRPGGSGGSGGGASDLACRTIVPGRLQQGGLLAFQPSSPGSAGGYDGAGSVTGEVHGYPRTLGGGGGNGAGPLTRASLPTETFQQLRQAVLTSLDITDNAEHTIDYEDGGSEVQEDILLESCPSVKEVGKSVFEVRASWLLCGSACGCHDACCRVLMPVRLLQCNGQLWHSLPAQRLCALASAACAVGWTFLYVYIYMPAAAMRASWQHQLLRYGFQVDALCPACCSPRLPCHTDAAHRPSGQDAAGVRAAARLDPRPRPAAPRPAASGPIPQVRACWCSRWCSHVIGVCSCSWPAAVDAGTSRRLVPQQLLGCAWQGCTAMLPSGPPLLAAAPPRCLPPLPSRRSVCCSTLAACEVRLGSCSDSTAPAAARRSCCWAACRMQPTGFCCCCCRCAAPPPPHRRSRLALLSCCLDAAQTAVHLALWSQRRSPRTNAAHALLPLVPRACPSRSALPPRLPQRWSPRTSACCLSPTRPPPESSWRL